MDFNQFNSYRLPKSDDGIFVTRREPLAVFDNRLTTTIITQRQRHPIVYKLADMISVFAHITNHIF